MATDFTTKEAAETYSEGVVVEELSLRPIMLDLINDIQDKTVLDLGCGDGRYSIELANGGASVLAIDASPHQIDIAKNKYSHKSIKYQVGDSSDIPIVKDKTIDLVFMNMVIPDLDGTEVLTKTIQEARRMLKENGRLIFSTLHPLYVCSDQDPSDKAVNFDKQSYFNEGSNYKAEATIKGGSVMKFNETHFSLTFISEVLKNNGFAIKRLIESKAIPDKDIYLPKYIVFECLINGIYSESGVGV